MTVIQGWADTGKLYTSGKLSSSLIECICQDKYGYLWIGTEYGLNKFDGYRFSTYIYEKDDTTSIVVVPPVFWHNKSAASRRFCS